MALGLSWGRHFARGGLLLGLVVLWGSVAVAADPIAGAPNADTPPLHPSAAVAKAGDCPQRPVSAVGAPSSIVVELDPDTLWRPRGSEVRFTIRGTAGAVVVKQTRVCFAWSSPDGSFDDLHGEVGSPQVRSVFNPAGATEYGAVVPGLRRLPDSEWWPRRVLNSGTMSSAEPARCLWRI